MRILSAIGFSPRGGSAHVARAVSKGLVEAGHALTLVAGSRTDLGKAGDATRFFAGLDVRPADFTAALSSADPMLHLGEPGEGPLHGSYEDRPNAPDRVFASLDALEFEVQVRAWERALASAGAADADVLHLHHLTPVNEAAQRIAPKVPRVGQLHGTELLMLEAIAAGAPSSWSCAAQWEERLRSWAVGCERLIVAPRGLERAAAVLELPENRFVAIGNGFDPECFRPRNVDRAAHWRRLLVDEPQGWAPGQAPGSVSYDPGELGALEDGVVLLYVGRFTAVKRLPLLIEAFARAQRDFEVPAGLVLVGGHPGEWEGEHPIAAIERTEARDVFLAGWHDHESLPDSLSAADAIVLASVGEQFGQVLVEGMACGLPAIAVNSGGPAAIVEDGVTGRLVPPDELEPLAAAIAEAVNEADLRLHRGGLAAEAVHSAYAWPAVVESVEAVLDEAAQGSPLGGDQTLARA